MAAVRRSKIVTDSDDNLAMELKNIIPNSSLPHNNDGPPSHQPPMYMQMIMSLQTAPPHSPSLPQSQSHTHTPVHLSSVKVPPKAYTPAEIKASPESSTPGRSSLQAQSSQPLGVFPAQGVHRGPSVQRVGSSRRTLSMDSVSVYSSASAPMDAHERMFQPMAVPSSAPAWATDMQSQQNSAGARKTSTTIREALAPETYVKPQPQWKLQSHRVPQPQWKPVTSRIRQRANSDSSSSVPPVPIPTPAVTRPHPALWINTTNQLSQTYTISEQSESESESVTSGPSAPPGLDSPLVAPLNFKRIEQLRREPGNRSAPPIRVVPPTPSSAAPPEVPLRSPSRPIVM